MKILNLQYDAFISHAVEDKIPIANELHDRLKEKGLNLWYSGREFSVGDRVVETIYEGLRNCRYGIVIISPTYLTKFWALREFFTLLEQENQKRKNIILPVLYNITPEELAKHDPSIADIFALRADRGLDYVCDELVKKIKVPPASKKIQPSTNRWGLRVAISTVMLMTIISSIFFFDQDSSTAALPTAKVIEATIKDRISALQMKTDADLSIQQAEGKPASPDEVKSLVAEYFNVQSYYRNEFTFHDSKNIIRSKKRVQDYVQVSLDSFSPENHYQMQESSILKWKVEKDRERKEVFCYFNKQPLTHRIIESRLASDSIFQVDVQYDNNIRMVLATLSFPFPPANTKKHSLIINGLPPTEQFTWRLTSEGWKLNP